MAGEWIGRVTYHLDDETRWFRVGVSRGCLQGLCAGVLVGQVATPALLSQLGTTLHLCNYVDTPVYMRRLTSMLGAMLCRLDHPCAKRLLLRLYHVLSSQCVNEYIVEYASMLLPFLQRLGPTSLGQLLGGPVYWNWTAMGRPAQPPFVYLRAEVMMYLSASVPEDRVMGGKWLAERYLSELLLRVARAPLQVPGPERVRVMKRAMRHGSSSTSTSTRRRIRVKLAERSQDLPLHMRLHEWEYTASLAHHGQE